MKVSSTACCTFLYANLWVIDLARRLSSTRTRAAAGTGSSQVRPVKTRTFHHRYQAVTEKSLRATVSRSLPTTALYTPSTGPETTTLRSQILTPDITALRRH